MKFIDNTLGVTFGDTLLFKEDRYPGIKKGDELEVIGYFKRDDFESTSITLKVKKNKGWTPTSNKYQFISPKYKKELLRSCYNFKIEELKNITTIKKKYISLYPIY